MMSILEAASLASVAGRTHAWMVAKKTPWIREYLYMSTVRGAWHWQGPRVTYDVGYVIVAGGAWAHLQHGRLIQSLCPPPLLQLLSAPGMAWPRAPDSLCNSTRRAWPWA